MPRKQPEMQIIMHWPKTELGWRTLIGRIAIFNELTAAAENGEHINMDVSIRRITQQDALDACKRLLEGDSKKSRTKRVRQ